MATQSKKDFTNVTKETVTVDDLCFLANKFVDQKLYDEAINIYESACKLFPENLALKINLGRVKNLSKQTISKPGDFVGQNAPSEAKQKRFFNKFQGLGEIYLKIGRIISSKNIFELTKISNPDFYLPYLNLGKLYYEEKDYKKAIIELEQCVKHNPFNEEAFNYLALSYYYNGEYHKALISMIDALLLSGDLVKDVPTSYQQKINLIIQKVENFTPKMRNQLIKTRREKLNNLYEEMESDIKDLLRENAQIVNTDEAERVVSEEQKNFFDLALEIKEHLLFKSLDDDSLMKIARITSKEVYLKDDYVFREDTESKGIYLLKSGKVEIRKKTPMGFISMGGYDKGSFFGEHDLITGRKHWLSAVALEECEILLIKKESMPELFAQEKHIAIHLLWYFWKSLSFQIRESNNRLKDFFDILSDEEKRKKAFSDKAKKASIIDMNRKLEALEGKGLSKMEMRLLASFSDSSEYKMGEFIFREGDQGDKLYIVVEGEVLISKTISGVGEEALTVLKTGDFFGEMALLGEDNLRSADAKANAEKVNLIGIKKEALKEILSIDSESAYQFLSILCRILAYRLSDINEKIFQWKIMQGGF